MFHGRIAEAWNQHRRAAGVSVTIPKLELSQLTKKPSYAQNLGIKYPRIADGTTELQS